MMQPTRDSARRVAAHGCVDSAAGRRGWWRRALGLSAAGWLAALLLAAPATATAQTRLLNAADVAAEALFKAIDPAFAADHKKSTGRDVRVETQFAASAAQARAVRDGLAADVVAFDAPQPIDALAADDIVAPDWRSSFPHDAAPWGDTVVLLVRTGNPKKIRDWADLGRAGVRVVMADPKTDATGRFGWLAAWGAALTQGRSEAQAARGAARLLHNALPFAPSADAALQAFLTQGQGDVLIALGSQWRGQPRPAGFERAQPVQPRASLLIEHPVAAVQRTTRKKGSAELAKAYLNFLFTPAAQTLAAAHGLQPLAGQPATLGVGNAAHRIRLFTLSERFGSRVEVQRLHFNDGGWLDRLRADVHR